MKPEDFQRCQVATPIDVVELMWRLAASKRRDQQKFRSVLDLGAGDARFAAAEDVYDSYTGVEVDEHKVRAASVPSCAQLVHADAMLWSKGGYDLCIGNPPYIRYHGLDTEWREDVLVALKAATGVALKRTANAFVIFLLKALQQTADDGLIVQLVPFEWVTRPSALELRAHIKKNRWATTVYRFDSEIFPTVLTTASITIIDKRRKDPNWKFGVIGKGGKVRSVAQPSGGDLPVLNYAERSSDLFALRGLSPGGQDIFVLTEEDRLHYGLKKGVDVTPCVTTLRHLAHHQAVLDDDTFLRDYVQAGRRCWLIRSDAPNMSPRLHSYLQTVKAERWQAYSTCKVRQVWWRYKAHPVPEMLFSSSFVGAGTKVLVNEVGAIAAGSVYGVVCKDQGRDVDHIAQQLRNYDFAKRVVSHSNNLKKVEVRQLNGVLAEII